ncbi:MAG: ATP-binding protein [Chitinispirillaceae bacterium]|jgi:light-regulated signal transduction histidine kinase (bacteriophytochrome)
MRMTARDRWFVAISLLSLGAVGFADYITGYELEFFVFYFIPVAVAGWAGKKSGAIALSLLSALVWLIVEYFSGQTYLHRFFLYWDAGIRLASFLSIGLLAVRVRKLLDKEHLLTGKLQKTADRLNASNAALIEKAAELEAFSTAVAHDLKSPLQSVLACAGIIASDYGPKMDREGKQAVDFIVRSASRMSQIIGDLLALSKITQQELQRERVDLSGIARMVYNELKQFDPERDAEIIIAADIIVHADPGLARILMENLIRNAWKFTAKEDRALIEFGTRHEDGTTVYFIRDNGIGLDTGHADRLFRPFQRLPSAKGFDGTGVGLATVKRIIDKHGGTVRAEGEPGKGATISFHLG